MFQRRKLIKNKPVTLPMYALSDRSLIHKPFMGYRLWPLCDRMYVRNTIKTLWGWCTLSKVAEPFVNFKKKIILKFLNVSLTVTHFKLQLFDISTFLLYEFDESDISACNYIFRQFPACQCTQPVPPFGPQQRTRRVRVWDTVKVREERHVQA